MDKQTLRKMIREQKKALTEEQIETASRKLAEQLFSHPAYRTAKSVYAYLAYNQEVRTADIIERALAEGKRVAVPKVMGNEMEFIWINSQSQISAGYRNIPEPDSGSAADDESALVITPGIAFDKKGNRYGYGGGFYDRYLKDHPYHTTLALCYEFQLFEYLDADAHDIPVNYVLFQEI